jgi:hypothetical protein
MNSFHFQKECLDHVGDPERTQHGPHVRNNARLRISWSFEVCVIICYLWAKTTLTIIWQGGTDRELNRGADGQATSFSFTEGTRRLKIPSSSRWTCISCPSGKGAVWWYERIIIIHYFSRTNYASIGTAFAAIIAQREEHLVMNDLSRLQAR